MFTGIIEATGTIDMITPRDQGARVRVRSSQLDMSDVALGDSIATNGICLTVVNFGDDFYEADVSSETLKRTGFAHYSVGEMVNLEKAMLPVTRFGGHIVSGHVDGVGTVSRQQAVGMATEYWIKIPAELARYIAEKGSVTIDGISLTVNAVTDEEFMITIVPHTAQETTIKTFTPGRQVNLEVDIIARYVERLLNVKKADGQTEGVTMSLLASAGFLK